MKLSVASSAELCLLFLLGIGRTSAQDALPTHTVQKGQKLRKLEVISSKNGKLTTELAIAPMRIDVPSAGLSFTTRAYNSKFPASTIRVNPGDDVEVLVQNNLGPQDQGCKEVESGVLKPNQFRAPNSTNLHVHGIYASMKEDNVLACIDPNTSLKYNYTIHPDSGSELLWYHPHFDGSSFLQLTNGMAGAFEVVDPEQEAKLELGGPGELLLVQMANLLPDYNVSDSIFYANTQTGSTMPLNLSFTHEDGSKPKFKGTLLFVNGDLQPTMSIGTGRWQRLKIINAMGGVTNAMTFHIVGAGKNDSNVSNTTSSRCEMAVLAYDGIFLSGSPRKQSSVFLPPGGRAEVAVRCLTPGAYNLQTRDVFTKEGDPTSTLGQSLASGHILLTMNVAEGNGSSTNTSSKLSDTLPGPPSFYSDLMPLKRDEIDGMHSIELSNFDGDMVINGVPFNHTMSYVMPIRSTQEWRITGGEGPTSFANMHPYHQHVSHFQLVDTTLPEDMTKAKFAELEQLFGVPGDWRDTVATFLDLGYRMRFQPKIGGELMIHCHILNHEDKGMMTITNVTV